MVRNPSVTFGMEGAPVSYLVAHPDTVERMRTFYDSTGISMFTEIIAGGMAQQAGFLERTHEYLEQEIPWLQCMLSLIPGMHINPAEGSFVLVARLPLADRAWPGRGYRRGLLSRQLNGYLVPLLSRTAGIEGDGCFCIAAHDRATNEALLTAMKKIVSGHSL